MTTTILGSTAALSWQPAAAGTVVLTVTLPDGSTATPVVTGSQPASVSYVTTAPGRHLLSWVQASTGASSVDVLDVWPADPGYLISLDDAFEGIKANGRAPAATTKDDLALFVAAATVVIEDMVGRLIPASRTFTTRGARTAVVLPDTGVSVSEVAVDGTALASTSWVADGDAGIVYPTTGAFPYGTTPRSLTVTYRTGAGLVDPNLRLACIEQVRFLWQTSKVGRATAAQDLGYTPSGYAVPYLVQGLVAASGHRSFGFA